MYMVCIQYVYMVYMDVGMYICIYGMLYGMYVAVSQFVTYTCARSF